MSDIYFCKLDCFVRYRLFQSFYTSYYGCELWSLRSRKLIDFCHAWNKGVRKIWNLPYNTHCYALPILCERLPVSDEICCRMIKFVRKCVTHDSTVIRFVASYGIQYGRNMSCLGQNVLFCMRQYNCSLRDKFIVSSSVSVDNIVHRQYVQSLTAVEKSLAECLRESVLLSERGCSFCQMISAALSVTLFCFYVGLYSD